MIPTALLTPESEKKILRMAQIPYATRLDTDQALVYLNLKQPRHLTELVMNHQVLPRLKSVGKTFCYRKEDLDRVRVLIDNGTIQLK